MIVKYKGKNWRQQRGGMSPHDRLRQLLAHNTHGTYLIDIIHYKRTLKKIVIVITWSNK